MMPLATKSSSLQEVRRDKGAAIAYAVPRVDEELCHKVVNVFVRSSDLILN